MNNEFHRICLVRFPRIKEVQYVNKILHQLDNSMLLPGSHDAAAGKLEHR
jgi:hypothetical protein